MSSGNKVLAHFSACEKNQFLDRIFSALAPHAGLMFGQVFNF